MGSIQMGDLVYAARDLFNDPVEETGESAIPGLLAGELLAAAGTRGVVVNIGHAEAQPDTDIFLVRFELDGDGSLSEPIGCLDDELRQGD